MNRKCDWCGRYHNERFIYNYYRDNNDRYKAYYFCSNACQFYFKDKTNLTSVDSDGYTPSEKAIEVRRRNQEIKDQYGSWANYKKYEEQKQKENNLRIIRNKLFLWVVCPFILYGFYKLGMSIFQLAFFSTFWVISLINNSD